MNTFFLKDAKVIDTVKSIWSRVHRAQGNFFSRLRKFMRFYRTFYKRQAEESRRKELEARIALTKAQEALQLNPHCPEAQL